jgi:hypothetical protein
MNSTAHVIKIAFVYNVFIKNQVFKLDNDVKCVLHVIDTFCFLILAAEIQANLQKFLFSAYI